MLRRQDSMLSSSRRENPPPTVDHHAKPTGCMSAIFKLLSKYQNRKKLLTFGKKNKNTAASMETKAKFLVEPKDSSTLLKEDKNNINKDDQDLEAKRFTTRDIMATSPMLPPEIRLPNDVGSSENTKTTRTLVARLMGLEASSEMKKKSLSSENRIVEEELVSNEEKRKRLLQALEKCSNDLESLKKIIMDVQSAEKHCRGSVQPETCRKWNEKAPPTSRALDEFTRPPWCRYSCSKLNFNGIMRQQSKQIVAKKPGDEDSASSCFFTKVPADSFKMKRKATTPNLWSSKAMIKSVDEVCNDIVWGEKREQRNLGLLLHNYISRDLIEELVSELGYHRTQGLPFSACRRRISF